MSGKMLFHFYKLLQQNTKNFLPGTVVMERSRTSPAVMGARIRVGIIHPGIVRPGEVEITRGAESKI